MNTVVLNMIARFLAYALMSCALIGCGAGDDEEATWKVISKSDNEQFTIGSFPVVSTEIPEELMVQIRKRLSIIHGSKSDFLIMTHTPGPGETWTMGPIWIESVDTTYSVHLGQGRGTIIAEGINQITTAADYASQQFSQLYRESHKLRGQQAMGGNAEPRAR